MLKALLPKEEWDALADEIKEHYVEEDGAYRLGVTPTEGFELADTAGLRKSLQSERARAGKAEKALKALTETVGDLDVDAARDALGKVEEMAGMDPEGKAKAAREAFEKNMTDKFQKDLQKRAQKHTDDMSDVNKRLDSTKSQLQRQLIEAAGAKAIAAAGGSVDLLLPIIERQMQMKEGDDGTFEAVIFGNDGQPRLSPVAGSSKLMSMAELVAETQADSRFSRGFNASGASGSGAGRSGARGGSGAPHVISAADAKDPAKYRVAKAAAEKAGKTLELAPA